MRLKDFSVLLIEFYNKNETKGVFFGKKPPNFWAAIKNVSGIQHCFKIKIEFVE